jgi:hypothetical protein
VYPSSQHGFREGANPSVRRSQIARTAFATPTGTLSIESIATSASSAIPSIARLSAEEVK